MRLPFLPEAASELGDAASWYERERAGYGGLFLTEVRRTVRRAAELPRSGQRVEGLRSEWEVRRFVVRRFPYLVVTASIGGKQTVVAVVHGRRRPQHWRGRLG